MSTNTSRLGLVKGDLIRMSYRLHRIVGAGGFGEVWQAEQLQGEAHLRNVAIKLFAAPDRGDGAFGWLHEARTIMEIEPMASVPRTFDVGVDPAHDVAFIAMELLHGHTLESRLARGSVPWRHALRIARAIADVLQHCHRHGIVHCDLKPQNIFLTDTGHALSFLISASRHYVAPVFIRSRGQRLMSRTVTHRRPNRSPTRRSRASRHPESRHRPGPPVTSHRSSWPVCRQSPPKYCHKIISYNAQEIYNVPYLNFLRQIYSDTNEEIKKHENIKKLLPLTFNFEDYVYLSNKMEDGEDKKKWRSNLLSKAKRESSYSEMSFACQEFCIHL